MSKELCSAKTLMLVDDHEMILLGLKNFIETKNNWNVAGIAKSIETAKSLLQDFSATGGLPQIIVIDIELGDENDFDLALYVREKFPLIKIIMYSMHDENDYVLKSRQLKIDGYISKASASEEFIKCLEGRLVEGQALIDDFLRLRLMIGIDTLNEGHCLREDGDIALEDAFDHLRSCELTTTETVVFHIGVDDGGLLYPTVDLQTCIF